MATAVLASVDGRISSPAEATISILDEGLVRGDGAFEVLKLYGGQPFRRAAHLDRHGRSAAALELDFDREALEAEVAELLARGGAPEGCLRVIITRGGRRLLTIEEIAPFAAGAAIALVELSPSEILAGVNSLSYAANIQASRIAAARGADEAVYVRPDGVVLEAPTSSIFWVTAGGELLTPALTVGILDSITRDVVVAALPVAEGSFDRADLLAAREAFLASTNREIQPISAVDGVALPTVGGAAAGAAAEALAAAVDAERTAARA